MVCQRTLRHECRSATAMLLAKRFAVIYDHRRRQSPANWPRPTPARNQAECKPQSCSASSETPQSSGVQTQLQHIEREWNRNQAECRHSTASHRANGTAIKRKHPRCERHAATQIEPHKRRFAPRAAPRTDHRPASTASHRTTVPRLTHPLVWRNTHCPSP